MHVYIDICMHTACVHLYCMYEHECVYTSSVVSTIFSTELK